MDNRFFKQHIFSSSYKFPIQHWDLESKGQPTLKIINSPRSAKFITPIPKPRKRKNKGFQQSLLDVEELRSKDQQYDQLSIIDGVRPQVDQWLNRPHLPNWKVTTETTCLLQHWLHREHSGFRLLFCQIAAIETAIWLTEVAPKSGKHEAHFIEHLANANQDANQELMRLALKLDSCNQEN